MKLKNTIYLFFLTCIAMFGSQVLAETDANTNQIQLRYQLKENASYGLTMILEQNITQTLPDQEKQNIKQELRMGYRFDVQKIDSGGNITAKVTYNRLSIKNQMPQGTVEIDTDNLPEVIPPPMKPLVAFKGRSFEMTFSPIGKVKEVKGIDTLLEELCAAMDDLDPSFKTMMCEQLKSQFGERAISEAMEQGLAIYPSTPVSVGDSWDQTFNVQNSCPMTLSRTSTLKSLEGETLVIGVIANISNPIDSKPIEFGPIKLKCDLKGSGKGTFTIDKTSGWMKSGTMALTVDGTMTTLPSELMPEEESWPMTLVIKTTIQAEKL